MKKAIVFLTDSPKKQTIDFAEKLILTNDFDVFVISDTKTEINSNKAKLIHISDDVCIDEGYKGCNINENSTHIKKEVIAWDKFLYYFCEIENSYDYFWVFEDDCFIPKIDTIKNLDIAYSDYDLVSANNNLKTDNALDWHWKHIVNKINPPYYYSMVCGVGLSKKLMNQIKKYVDENKTLFHIEAMFNTIAMQNDLSVISPLELKTIVWQGHWDIDFFIQLQDNVFHPIKDIENHDKLRQEFEQAVLKKYKPKKKLPDYILEIL
jgi:hypothetical protein